MNARHPHVLVDLNGWTAGHAMGALVHRPAPLVINYMGFAGSTGAEFVDFAAFDPIAAPPEHASSFSERLLFLPRSYFVTDFLRADFSIVGEERAGGDGGKAAALREARRAEGLDTDAVLLCNHDQGYKIDPHRFSSWVHIGRRKVGAMLPQMWLLGQEDASTNAALRMAAGMEVGDRIVFAPKVAVRAHVRRIRLCQLALDTATIGAHTTAANYLWARVPVVTLPGQHVMSRVAASLLLALARDSHSTGGDSAGAAIAATIARTEDDYIAVARALVRGARRAADEDGGGAGDGVNARTGGGAGRRCNGGKRTDRASGMYVHIRQCLCAATEPLDALSAPRHTLGGARSVLWDECSSLSTSITPPDSVGYTASTAASGPTVFDTGRWVRDWERALVLTVDLRLATSSSRQGDALRGAGGERGAGGFSIVVSS